jgi:trehalose synthase
MDESTIPALPPERFDAVLDPDACQEWSEILTSTRRAQGDATFWHINSTAAGGGVAEMLQSILGYLVGADLRVRWLVLEGNDDFFVVTKQLHHLLHGEPGEDGELPANAREIYEGALASEVKKIVELVQPGDTVVLHDPQTLGLAPALADRGTRTVWACHSGADTANDYSRSAWTFLQPYVERTDRQVFSRPQYVPDCLDDTRVAIIPPCLDAFSPKNQPLADDVVTAVLCAARVVDGESSVVPEFVRQDQTPAKVTTRAGMIETQPVPADAPIVTQVSRWDTLKDHAGVMRGFVEHVDESYGAHLVLAGPSPDSVTDDPEGSQVLADLRAEWEALPEQQRSRVHIACLPMDDLEENAAIVNALQRRSAVVVQKSLAEGFGLTVAEAMWKSRPTVGSRLGGIQDQIEHEVSGLLIDDPTDPSQLGAAVTTLLRDPELGKRMGETARKRVISCYLAPCHLTRYLELIASIPAPAGATGN